MKKSLFAKCLTALTVASVLMSGCNTGGQKPVTPVDETTRDVSNETTTAKSQETESVAETEAVTSTPIKLPDYTFTKDNFPKMDGSTSLVPLAKALTEALLNIDEKQAEDMCIFNRTTQSFRNLSNNEADMLIVSEPSSKVYDEMAEAGFKYRMEDIATEALIFVVNKNNPIESLTTEQIRDIYSGKIKNWKEVGGNDAEIIAFQRNEGAGSQALMTKLVMQGAAMTKAPSGLVATEMGELMQAVKSYDNSANAIGYSVYYYANDMKMADDLKIIAVDGVTPEADTIRKKEYPHLNSYYCVIPEETDVSNERAKSAKVIFDWLVSTDGQRLISSKGYVSIKDVSDYHDTKDDGKKVTHKDIYKRLNDAAEGTLTTVEARNDYGMLIPYKGNALYVNIDFDDEEEGYSYIGGYMSGFFDTNGRLVTDPVYSGIHMLTYYDPVTYNEFTMPFYTVAKYYDDEKNPIQKDEDGFITEGNIRMQFIAADGSFVSPEYDYISGMKDHIFCKDKDESNDFVIYDTSGNIVMTYEEFDKANSGKVTELLKDSYPLYEALYGEGYYVFCLNDSYYFVDENTKKIVLGPYEYAQQFDKGAAFVRKDDYAAIINKDGINILGAGYSSAEYLSNGNKLGVKDNHVDLIDPSGYLIKTIDNYDTIGKYDWGFYVAFFTNDSHWNIEIFDNDGNELYKENNSPWQFCDKIPVGYVDGTEQGPLASYDETGTGIWLMNVNTGKRLFIKDASYAYPFYTMNSIADMPYITVSKYDDDNYTSHEWLFDEDLNEKMYVDGSINVICDKLTNEWLLISYDNNGESCTIYDKNLKEIQKAPVYPDIYDGYTVYMQGDTCIGEDAKGNVIFCYNMTSLGDE